MPLLDRNGVKPDAYARDGAAGIPIVPSADLLAGANAVAIDLPNDVKPETLLPYLSQLGLIAIAFPSSADGRGLSQARRLRRLGFAGTLRAVGPLIADQFPDLLACGFDEVELTADNLARQPLEQWRRAARSITYGYQRGYGDAGNILDQRRAARITGHA
jgi:uncharacterized protein (DUF934 family)